MKIEINGEECLAYDDVARLLGYFTQNSLSSTIGQYAKRLPELPQFPKHDYVIGGAWLWKKSRVDELLEWKRTLLKLREEARKV